MDSSRTPSVRSAASLTRATTSANSSSSVRVGSAARRAPSPAAATLQRAPFDASTTTRSSSSAHSVSARHTTPSHSSHSIAASTAAAAASTPYSTSLSSAVVAIPSSTDRTTRDSILEYASALGLDSSWKKEVEEIPSVPEEERSFPPQLASQFLSSSASHSHSDYLTWLSHSHHMRSLLTRSNMSHEILCSLDTDLAAHEREDEVRQIVSMRDMEGRSEDVKKWTQHLATIMTTKEEIATSPVSSSSSSSSAPTSLHPSLRTLLHPPVVSRHNTFLHIEPEFQADVRDGIESMCRDIALWRPTGGGGSVHSNQHQQQPQQQHDDSTPASALAWTSQLSTHQSTLDSLLHTISSNYSRLQRVADGIHGAHTSTKALHEREKESERKQTEWKQEEVRRRMAAWNAKTPAHTNTQQQQLSPI